jgi:hypothetical protein
MHPDSFHLDRNKNSMILHFRRQQTLSGTKIISKTWWKQLIQCLKSGEQLNSEKCFSEGATRYKISKSERPNCSNSFNSHSIRSHYRLVKSSLYPLCHHWKTQAVKAYLVWEVQITEIRIKVSRQLFPTTLELSVLNLLWFASYKTSLNAVFKGLNWRKVFASTTKSVPRFFSKEYKLRRVKRRRKDRKKH